MNDRKPLRSGETGSDGEPRLSRLDVGGEELVILSYRPARPRIPEGLTEAEREVLRHLLDGLSTTAIAAQRGTSELTVSTQLARIYEKAGVHSRAELVAWMFAEDDPPAPPHPNNP